MNALRRAWNRYLAALNSGTFRTDETGATVFFPSGILGRGYVVNADQEATVRRFLGRYYIAVFALVIVVAPVIGLGTLLLIAPVLGVYWFWSRRFVAELPVSDLRMSAREAGRQTYRVLGRRWLAVFLTGSIVMTAASVGMLMSPKYVLTGLLGVVLFGFGSFRFATLLIRHRGDSPDAVEPLP